MKISAVKLEVQHALLKFKEYRDDDYRLIAYLLSKRVKEHNRKTGIYTPDEIKAIDKFLVQFAGKKYGHPSSIKRVRAKLQEVNPKLRGPAFYKRHNIARNQVEVELRNVDWTEEVNNV